MMSLKRLVAISRKEFHHVTRDLRTLLALIAPAFLLMMWPTFCIRRRQVSWRYLIRIARMYHVAISPT
jgi:hypothetical protein